MSRTRRAIAAITLLLFTLTTLPTTTAATNSSPKSTAITRTSRLSVQVRGGTGQQRTAVEQAVAVYTRRNLMLPGLTVRIHSDEVECDGHGGIFRYSGSDLNIDLCSDLPYVIIHELGHAWTHANMTAADRRSYAQTRGLPTWNDWSYEWKERAAEDAAFVLQQNLMATTRVRATARWDDLISAFEALTRQHSPVRIY